MWQWVYMSLWRIPMQGMSQVAVGVHLKQSRCLRLGRRVSALDHFSLRFLSRAACGAHDSSGTCKTAFDCLN